MQPLTYDVAVSGAGPAGSATAERLARQGVRVLLLEEHRQVGLPPHCSGLVTPRTLVEADMDEDVVVNRITGAVIHSPTGKELTIGGDRVHAYAIDRPAFDRALARRAVAAGAELALGAKLTGIERQNGHLRLRVRRDGRETDLTTRLLIGADGAQSFVAKWSGVRRVQSEPALGLGALVSLPALAPETVRVFVGRAVAPSFFAWLIPAGGGMARLGIGCGDGARPATHLRRLVEAYPALFRGMEVCSYSGGLIPLVTLDRIVADNVMLVGDAAGQIKPTSGGGIYTSLVGARHCARVAAEALTRGDVRAAALAPYQTAWEADMGGEMSRGWDLRAAVLDLSDAELDRLVGILRSARLGALIARHGDIDYPSRLASRLVRARPLLYGFLRIALRGSWPALPRLPQRHASGHHAPPSGRSDPVKQRGSWFSSRP